MPERLSDQGEIHVGPEDPPQGASAWGNTYYASQIGLTGRIWRVLRDAVFTVDGLGAIADGSDALPPCPNLPSHHTIYPTRRMRPQDFIDKFLSLPWEMEGSLR